jgi:excisionase family DNA binding protein
MPQKPHHPENSGFPNTPMLPQDDVSTPTPERLKSQLGGHEPNSPAVAAAAEFLQVKEIAAAMKVSVNSVIRLVKDGRLPALNLSRGRRATYRIPREAFEQFKQSAMVPMPPRVLAKPVMKLPSGVELFI